MKRIIKRKKIRLPLPAYETGHAFFINISTYQKYPWFLRHTNLSNSAISLMRDLCCGNKINMYAWCIMPDHVHFLSQGNDIIGFVRLFKGNLTPAVAEKFL